MAVTICLGDAQAAKQKPVPFNEQQLTSKLKFYQSIGTLEATFTQKKLIKDLDVHLISEGRFKLIRPEKLIWEIVKPSPVRVLLDRKEIRIETGTGASFHAQVLNLGDSLPDKATKNLTVLIAWLKLDAHALYKQYQVFPVGEGTYHFEPREKGQSPFEDLVMTLGSSGHLKRLMIHEVSGDTLEIEFGKPKITQ